MLKQKKRNYQDLNDLADLASESYSMCFPKH